MRCCVAQLSVILLLIGLAGCATPGNFRNRMAEAAAPGKGVKQIRFVQIGVGE